MKKHLIIASLLFTTLGTFAQTLDEGKQLMYHERWQSAEKYSGN